MDRHREGRRGRDQRLTGRELGDEGLGSSRVELAEYVVEEQYGLRAHDLGTDLVPCESQSQRQGALLPLGGVCTRVEPGEPQPPLVPVGADERDTSIHLGRASLHERGA